MLLNSKIRIIMENLVDKALKEMISNTLLELERITDTDVLCYSGPIVDGNENIFLDSAGTIFCMSGDEIWMDFFSVLGPEDKINDVLENYKFSQNDVETIKRYEKSVEDFEKMIDRGMAKSRGYNLQTIEDVSNSIQNNYIIK